MPIDFRPLVYFTNYLKRGYYPFVLEDDFDVRLQQIINHTLESEIAAILSASRNNIEDYSLYIEEAGFIAQLRDATGGVRGLGKVDKIYLDNTNLIYSLGREASDIGNIRETFFLNQMRVGHDVIASPVSDFLIDDMTFEVGGKNKKQKQIQGIEKAYVVKDDIEAGYKNVIPLWQLGLSY